MGLRARDGFQLSGHLNGTVAPPAHRFQKAVDRGQDSVIYVGDPIAITSAGTLARLPTYASAGANLDLGDNYIGVCTGIFENEDGRPLTHRTRKYAATADAFWLDVIDDPDAVWETSFNLSANQTNIGSLAYVAYSSANTAAGISGAGLAGLSVGSATLQPFRIIGVVNLQRDGANASNADQSGRVRVIAGNHLYRQTTDL